MAVARDAEGSSPHERIEIINYDDSSSHEVGGWYLYTTVNII